MSYLKYIITAALFAGSLSAHAGYQKFWLKFDAPTEQAVVELVDSHLPAIQDGTYEPFRRELRYNDCWPIRANQIEIIGLNVVAKYKRNRQTGQLEKYHRGTLSVWHRNCRDDDD